MALDRPQDFAWMFILIAIFVVTFGYGLSSIQAEQDVQQNSSFFYDINDRINNDTGLKGAADAQRTALAGQESAGEESSEESFILRSYQAMLDLGRTWGLMEDTVQDGTSELGIPVLFLTLIASGLLITFAVIMYTWLRGN